MALFIIAGVVLVALIGWATTPKVRYSRTKLIQSGQPGRTGIVGKSDDAWGRWS